MKQAEYTYNAFDIANSILIGFFGSYTTLTLLNNAKKSDNIIVSLFWIIASAISLELIFVWPFHFLAIFAMDFVDFELYFRMDWTIYSFLAGTIFSLCGFIFSFFLMILNAKKNYKLEFPEEDITFFEYLQMDLKFKKRDCKYLLFGAVFIGPGILVLHIIGMYSMVFPGFMDFKWNLQIFLCFFGVVGGYIFIIEFYFTDSIKYKIFFSVVNTTFVGFIHFKSVFWTIFYSDLNIKVDCGNPKILSTKGFGNVIIVMIYASNHILREISHYWFNNNIVFFQYVSSILKKKEESIGYLERITEKIRKDEDKIETMKLIPKFAKHYKREIPIPKIEKMEHYE